MLQENISGEYSNVAASSASLLQISENNGGRITGHLTAILFNTSGTAKRVDLKVNGYDEHNKITITCSNSEFSFTLSGTMSGDEMLLNGINNGGLIGNTDFTKNNIAAYQSGVKAIFTKEEKIKADHALAAIEKSQLGDLSAIERNANNATQYEQNMITVFIKINSQGMIDRAKAIYAAMLNRASQLYALEKRYSEIKTYQAQDDVDQLNDNIISLNDRLDSVNMNRNNSDKQIYNLENTANNLYAKSGCLTLGNLLNDAATGAQYSATKTACMNAYAVYQKLPSLESSANKTLSSVAAYQDNISSEIKEIAEKANAMTDQ